LAIEPRTRNEQVSGSSPLVGSPQPSYLSRILGKDSVPAYRWGPFDTTLTPSRTKAVRTRGKRGRAGTEGPRTALWMAFGGCPVQRESCCEQTRTRGQEDSLGSYSSVAATWMPTRGCAGFDCMPSYTVRMRFRARRVCRGRHNHRRGPGGREYEVIALLQPQPISISVWSLVCLGTHLE
jgi:hypothetical protein